MAQKAEKLRQRLAATKAGWSDGELWTLLTSYGFRSREGKHTVYQHEEHLDLTLVVPRSGELKKVYPREAERLLIELETRTKAEPRRKK